MGFRRASAGCVGVKKIAICCGFDGSSVADWSALRAETVESWQFTPTYGPSRRVTIWNPAEWSGRIPRTEVHAAVNELGERYRIVRFYADPRSWETEIDDWAHLLGDDVVVSWPTNQITRMHAALDRFETDLISGALTHDGCPITARHVANARKLAKPGDRYILGKPSEAQKIDAAMASVLAHEAAADARAAGWGLEQDHKVIVFR